MLDSVLVGVVTLLALVILNPIVVDVAVARTIAMVPPASGIAGLACRLSPHACRRHSGRVSKLEPRAQ